MNGLLRSISSVSIALVLVACGGSEDPASDGSPSPGAGGTDTVGAGGTGAGGSTGTTGGSATGVGGTSQGGTTGGGQPGSLGGGAGTPGGGSGGTAAGGGAVATGGGTGGVSAGGTSGSAGETVSGGSPASGAGGAPVGGDTGQGGLGGGGAGAPPVDEPTIVTSAQNAWWQIGTATEVTGGNADVTVNDGSAQQTWTGFGGTFNEKGWDALSALSQADRDRALSLLFDAVDGARFVYGRIPIGASDYGTSRYTLDDTPNDTSMASFSIDRDRMRLIPYIKAALAVNPDIYFWGSPWTPPPWMKDNNAYDRGNMKDDDAILTAHALYLAKFVEEYGKEGITVRAIHPQNEPGYQQDYPSCGWSGNLMAKFIGSYLGPTFQERGVMADIFIGTMSNPTADRDVLNTVMGNATAKAFIKGHGLQWGMFDAYSQLSLDKSLPIWQTEHKCGNYPWEGGTDQSKAPNDFAYGVESWGLIRDWIKKGVNAYSAWNMVLDTVGRSLDTVRPWAQNALLAVDTSAKTLIVTPTYYVFRHFSQYVDPGAQVVGTSGGDAIAFKNPDGSIVAVIYNSGGAKMETVSIGGKMLQFQMPGSGWATVNAQ